MQGCIRSFALWVLYFQENIFKLYNARVRIEDHDR